MKQNTNSFKSLLNVTALSSILVFSSCMAQMSESETDPSAGLNGSFELVKNNLPVNWLVYSKNTVKEGDFDIRFDDQDPKEGKQSLIVKVRTCSDEGGRFSPGIAQEITAEAAAEYDIRLWIKNKDSKVKVNVSGVDAFHKAEGPIIQILDTSNEWKEYVIHYTMPKDMKRLRIEIAILKPGTVNLDDIRVLKI